MLGVSSLHVNSKLVCHHTRKLLPASISQFMTLLNPPTAHDYAWCVKMIMDDVRNFPSLFWPLVCGSFTPPTDLKPLNNAFIRIEVYKMLSHDHSQY